MSDTAPAPSIFDALQDATDSRFDGLPDNTSEWTYLAALAVLKDLTRIVPTIGELAPATRLELTQRVADIVEEAARPTLAECEEDLESMKENWNHALARCGRMSECLSAATGLDHREIFAQEAANVVAFIRRTR